MSVFGVRGKRFGESGQSMIETALIIPFLLLVLFNAINFAWFYYVAIHLAQAPRDAVEYSIQGFQTPAQLTLPAAGPTTSSLSVSYLTYSNLVGDASLSTPPGGGLPGASSTPIRVCSKSLGVTGTGTSLKANCSVYPTGAATFATVDADPEAPLFVLHRVDIQYTVTPLIKAAPFGLTLLPSLTLHRQVSMRAID